MRVTIIAGARPNFMKIVPVIHGIERENNAKAVVTVLDGITEETTVMGIHCMTLRENTERPETIIIATNELLGTDPKAIPPAFKTLLSGEWGKGSIPALWGRKNRRTNCNHLLALS